METWVLIISILLNGNNKAGLSMISVEFSSKAACEAAGSAVKDKWDIDTFTTMRSSQFVCVKK